MKKFLFILSIICIFTFVNTAMAGITLDSYVTVPLADLDNYSTLCSITKAPDGNLYVGHDSNSKLYKVNITTGSVITSAVCSYGTFATGVSYGTDGSIGHRYGTTNIVRIAPDLSSYIVQNAAGTHTACWGYTSSFFWGFVEGSGFNSFRQFNVSDGNTNTQTGNVYGTGDGQYLTVNDAQAYNTSGQDKVALLDKNNYRVSIVYPSNMAFISKISLENDGNTDKNSVAVNSSGDILVSNPYWIWHYTEGGTLKEKYDYPTTAIKDMVVVGNKLYAVNNTRAIAVYNLASTAAAPNSMLGIDF